MKNIASRTAMALLLAGLLLFGLLTFFIRYFIFSDDWFSHSHSSDGLSVERVLDRGGKVLYAPKSDQTYSKNAAVRRATVHLVGDTKGYIDPLMLRQYLPELAGFDKINGTYGMQSGTGVVELTVESSIQTVALQALGSRKGTVGVYNYRTGEILCAVTSPTFDPCDPPVVEDGDSRWDGLYLHRFFSAAYTPGSIFKLVTTAAALETIPDILDQHFTCTGSIKVNGEVIRCQGGKAHGEQTVKEALANSCNCAFAQIAQEVGPSVLQRKAEQIGVTQSLFVDGYRTRAGSFDLTGADKNRLAWAGIGQDVDLVNPCQYMTYMGAIASGGRAALPYLVRRVSSNGEERYRAEPQRSQIMITRDAAEVLTEFMHNNVVRMYAPVNFSDVKVCAKSGTAEVAGSNPTSTFAGFLDSEKYPLAFVVVVEEGGSGAASPVAAAVLRACINVMYAESK